MKKESLLVELFQDSVNNAGEMFESDHHFIHFTSLCHRGAVLEIAKDPKLKTLTSCFLFC